MEKWCEFCMILVTSILLVLVLYIFKGYIPSVDEYKGDFGQNFQKEETAAIGFFEPV